MNQYTKKTILLWGLLALAALAVVLLIALSHRFDPAYSAEELLQRGGELLGEGDYKQAKTVFDELIRTDQLHPMGYLGSARASLGLNQPGDARAALEKGLEKLPGNRELAGLLSEIS